MTIKRNELDILNKAIQITEVKAFKEFERDEKTDEYNKKNNICFKKEDYKLKYEYELGIRRLESSIDICIAEINGLNDQLNLLRWLYQERYHRCKKSLS